MRTQSKYVSLKYNNIPHEVQQLVYRAVIFQLSAALEEYIKSLFEGWVYLIKKQRKTINDIPKEILTLSIIRRQANSYKKFILDSDESKLIKLLIANDEFIRLCYNADAEASKILGDSDYVSDRKYPSEKNLPVLFKRFGVINIFDEMAKKGKKDYKKILKSFSDIRTEIAHQHPPPDLTHKDVQLQLNRLSGVVDKIDRIMWSHIRKISSETCWPK